MTFRARYPGRCAACTEPIEVDDLLTYDEDDVVVHADCTESAAAALGEAEVCPRCFTTKAVNGACACD